MGYIIGIDDVTRCPVIGSLICVGALIDESFIPCMKKLGVKDSKVITHKRIQELAKELKRLGEYHSVKIDAKMISKSKTDFNMNDMECAAFCSIADTLLDLQPDAKVQINNFDRTREKFIQRAEKLGFNFDWSKWIIDHENETRDTVVGAASIVAKDLSLKEYEKLRELYGDFGSGNPNDERTLTFLREKLRSNEHCPIIRYNWKTIKRLKGEINEETN